ncbi:replicative DNA helicase, partial [bacterium]|nr:replicative DNA helicase [bacterium]
MQQKRGNYSPSATKQTEGLLGKNLPANNDAERSVLGAILLNDSALSKISDILLPDDFYSPAHSIIFRRMLDIVQDRKRIDVLTLQDELDKHKELDKVGGVVFLVSLQEEIPAVGLVAQHAKIIKEKAVLRQLIGAATGIIGDCYDQQDLEITTVLDQAENQIMQISNTQANQDFVQLNIWLKKTFKHLSDIKTHSKGITGVPTGFAKLDEFTSGLQRSDLIILAARPSMGKTAIALNLAVQAAHQGIPTGFISLEMSAEQLTLRLLSTESAIAHQNIRNATITSDEWIELTNVAARLGELKIFIDDTAGLNIMDLRTRARRLKIDHDIQFLVVDYLQLLHSPRKHENRHQEVSEISRALKALAKELNIP